MAGLKNIKLKIQSVKKTRQVTRAMEAVSAVKMRKSQSQALLARPYARAALRILGHVSETHDLKEHPFMQKRETGALGIVLVTSDKGLAGSLNSAVLKKADEATEGEESPVFICLGRRGLEYANRRGFEVAYSETNISDNVEERALSHITAEALKIFTEKDIREVRIIYTNFTSTFEQSAEVRSVLPLQTETLTELVDGIVPDKGKYSEMKEADTKDATGYEIEPSAEEVFETILPKLANIAVFHALLESKASEHSARMVAMKNATDKAGEVAKDLNLAYNKARQAAITAEVSEITSGIEAMR